VINLRSNREIQQMRRPGLAVWNAHQIASRRVKPGVTTGEIDKAVEQYFERINAYSLFKHYPHGQSGKPAFPAVTCMSVNEEVVHGIPGDRELVEGDIVSIDTGCRIAGWCGDAAWTYPVGDIDPQVQRLLDVTRGTLDLAFKLLGEKDRWSQIASEMSKFVADNGFYTVECFVGHGIGQEMHEEPQVPNFVNRSLKRNGDFEIKKGLVIAVEPMVNIGTKRVKAMADDWTQVTYDGKPSAHFEHTIAITDKGPWRLTGEPTEEEIASGLLADLEVVQT